jgi:hypothetical protein
MIRCGRLVAALLALAWLPSTRAHEFKLDSVATGFVRIDPDAAHVVVRVPLHALRGVRFPLKGREIVNAEAGPATEQAVALVRDGLTLAEDGRPLAAARAAGRLSLPSDRSFETYEGAVAHVARPATAAVYADQGHLDVHLGYPIRSASSRFTVRTTLAPELGETLKLAVRYQPPGEPERAMVITRGSGEVALNPTRARAAATFAALGVEHILGGLDHLLFLLCLVVPLARVRQAIPIVTAFTVAHSVTLLGAALGVAPGGEWFPPFVETVIAASIVYMAIENVLGAGLRRRWIATALFGLVHGFGFSYGLRQELQFAGDHLAVSLLAFNAGIELGQLLVVVALVPLLALLHRDVLPARAGVAVVSALVAHTGWHWTLERADVLWTVGWATVDRAALMAFLRAVAIALAAGGVLRLAWPRLASALARLPRRRASPASPRSP